MFRVFDYYGRYQGLRGTLGRLPSWAQGLLFMAALPGLALMALSILAFLVSLSALFLLTLPVYRLLQWVTGFGAAAESPAAGATDADLPPSPGRRHVDVTIIQ